MIGSKLLFEDCVESTNKSVAMMVQSGKITHGTALLAGFQTTGMGQRGAVWYSLPHENLLYSLYLEHANLSIDRQFVLNQAISLAVHSLVKSLGVEAQIKWPNDILIGSAKVSGLLTENQLAGDRIRSSIVGIGLNLNQQEFGAYHATSLHLQTGLIYDPKQIALQLAVHLNSYYELLLSGADQYIQEAYLKVMWLKDVRSVFESEGITFDGIIRGLNTQGQLLIELEDGRLNSFANGTIRFVERELF